MLQYFGCVAGGGWCKTYAGVAKVVFYVVLGTATLGVVYASFFGVVGFEGVVLVLYVAYIVVFVAGYGGLCLGCAYQIE